MREYKRKIYRDLPDDIYKRALEYIRGRERLESELADLIDARHVSEVPVKNRTPSNPTAKIVEQRESRKDKLRIIDDAFNCIPEEYRTMVYRNITGTPMYEIEGASGGTLHTYRKRVLIEVAHRTGDMDEVEYNRLIDKNGYRR